VTTSPSSTYFDVFRNKQTCETGTDPPPLNTQPRFVIKNQAINCLQHPLHKHLSQYSNVQGCKLLQDFEGQSVGLLRVFTSYFFFPPACVSVIPLIWTDLHPSIRLWRMLRRRLSTEVITSARQPSAQLDCCEKTSCAQHFLNKTLSMWK